ncbi:MAG: copper-translocating P-type ATPase [Proteobacteria bacterium]|nr:MAG: copper-translocating P-type ATPase [Pseudomonadota bacterium]
MTPKWLAILSLFLSLPLVLPMILAPLGISFSIDPRVQWLIATLIQFGFGFVFLKNAALALKRRRGNMDLLVSLGTLSAYGLSIYQMFSGVHAHLYFESSALIISLVLVGKALEGSAKQKSLSAIRALHDLKPEQARLRLKNGDEKYVDLDSVFVGDSIVILPGERVPTDARLIEGRTEVDESAWTGESLPVAKENSDSLMGGTMNRSGRIVAQVTATGSDTQLSRLIDQIENAQAKKAPIQKTVDRVSAVFVPVVLVIAALTLVAWALIGHSWEESILHAVSVLVIACPCALGLATPTAILVGTGVAARNGILIKDIEALEFAQSLNVIAFDKTGTLTRGEVQVTQRVIAPMAIPSEQLIDQWAQALNKTSLHPLSQAVVAQPIDFSGLPMIVTEAQQIPGKGILGKIEGTHFVFGNASFMRDMDVPLRSMSDWSSQADLRGESVSFLARITDRGELLAAYSFSDELRESSAQVIQLLRDRKIEVALLSGDRKPAVERVARALGIQNYSAELLPEDKVQKLELLKQGDKRVGMVGDGINDAASLTAASVGFAMGGGADIAHYAAGITLMKNDLSKVIEAIDLSQATYRKIKQGLFWAFIYNAIGIPFAASGLISPVLAGGAMALSSVSVILNALSLKRWKAPQ